MSSAERYIRAERVVLPSGLAAACIGIRDGRVVSVGDISEDVPADHVDEVGDAVLMPGAVDVHVHINEPGRAHWEGFETATRAAAAGGITALVEMPLNSIPATTSVAALEQKLRTLRGQCSVDVGLWGGVVPGNTAELRPLYEAGVLGFKCFLVPSGVDEFEHVTEADLHQALPVLAELDAVLLVHAELPERIGEPAQPRREYASYLASRPRAAEDDAIALVIRLARQYDARMHIVHLVSSNAVDALRRARDEGQRISVETCPHYLTFAAEDIAAGATHFKCAPPIREAANREALWRALGAGTIDFIASDHSPCPPSLKLPEQGDFGAAWGGIASLQFALAATWTEARARGFDLSSLARWMCSAPAQMAGLGERKGQIAVGYDADLIAFDPDGEVRLSADQVLHRHKVSPYVEWPLRGLTRATWLRGRKVFEDGAFRPGGPTGRWLPREPRR